jgi:microcystin-dependent protein
MANIVETPTYDAGVYLIELSDPVVGGTDGISNKQAKALANRTAYLKAQTDDLTANKAPLASPAFTGTPTAPTAAPGTNTTQLATTAFVAAGIAAAASPLSNDAPAALADAAAAGAAGTASRADHVHPLPPVATTSSKGLMSASDKTSLDGAAPKVSPALTGIPTAPTAPAGTNTTQLATTAFVSTAVADVVGGAPAALNTLAELAAAVGNDANYATTNANALALKAPLASPALTGTPTAPTALPGNKTTQLATTAFVDAAVNVATPAGAVMAFAMNAAPDGWLKCNGAAISRTTYAKLYLAIGTTFGAGDGSTTFNLPDLRGEFVRGWDDARGVDASRGFGSAQADMFKSHTHDIPAGTSTFQTAAGSVWVNGSAKQTGATGGSETRPRNIALLYCIKY